MTSKTVDLVYTWVNSTNSEWQKQFKSWSKKLQPSKKSTLDSRFRDCQELRYSLRSSLKYAEFIQNIYIVVSDLDQIPDWLNKTSPKIKIITHQQIFPEEYHQKLLPTFNSVAIELHIHRIPGLSENYLYLNDDMFFGSTISIDDLIDPITGKAYIFLDKTKRVGGTYNLKGEYHFTDSINYTNKVLDKIQASRSTDSTRYLLQHLPYIHNKSCDLEIYQLLHEKNIYFNSCTRFRENKNIKTQSLFYPYYSQIRGYSLPYFQQMGIKVSKDHHKYYRKILKKRPKLFCLNKLPKLDSDLQDFYKKMYP